MKKQFVTYPIALALKEFGFNESCLARFSANDFQLILNPIVSAEITICAPLWQQAIDWLSYKHQLFVEVELTDNTHAKYYQYCIVDSKNREYNDKDMVDQAYRMYNFMDKYNTYEEAREAAILEAIKIVKGE